MLERGSACEARARERRTKRFNLMKVTHDVGVEAILARYGPRARESISDSHSLKVEGDIFLLEHVLRDRGNVLPGIAFAENEQGRVLKTQLLEAPALV